MIAAVLMGRKGSKGFPGKNLHPLFGKPLAYFPMKAAHDTPEIDKTYISTDDERLIALANENSVGVIIRPPELCTDAALGEDVYKHAYGVIRQLNPDKEIELIVLLMCNAPTITPAIISEGVKVLRENLEYDSAVSVSRYNMWSPLRARKIDSDGLLKPFVPFETFGDPKTLNCDRDSQGDVWFADMGASIVRPRCLENLEDGLLPQKWMGQKIYPLQQWGGFDIDYEWQIPMAVYWLKKHGI
ncbi:MAG: cytidylyltransferase [Nitrospirae bacterium]|nr:cytidylyltransferase [Nitrospirota bacterium]